MKAFFNEPSMELLFIKNEDAIRTSRISDEENGNTTTGQGDNPFGG